MAPDLPAPVFFAVRSLAVVVGGVLVIFLSVWWLAQFLAQSGRRAPRLIPAAHADAWRPDLFPWE